MLRMMVAVAVMLGAAGYAWQGRPAQAGSYVGAKVEPIAIEPGLVAFREAVFAPDAGERLALARADSQLLAGDATAAVRGLLADIQVRPASPALWTALGTTLALHDGGAVSPAAQFAFNRAMRITPGAPGPAFFLGLAQVNAGEIGAARPAWAYALACTPADAPYRRDIAERLAAIDDFLGQPGAR